MGIQAYTIGAKHIASSLTTQVPAKQQATHQIKPQLIPKKVKHKQRN